MAKKGTVVKKHVVTIRYRPGQNPQADATIAAALAAARCGNSWTSRFRGPKGTRISNAVKGG